MVQIPGGIFRQVGKWMVIMYALSLRSLMANVCWGMASVCCSMFVICHKKDTHYDWPCVERHYFGRWDEGLLLDTSEMPRTAVGTETQFARPQYCCTEYYKPRVCGQIHRTNVIWPVGPWVKTLLKTNFPLLNVINRMITADHTRWSVKDVLVDTLMQCSYILALVWQG